MEVAFLDGAGPISMFSIARIYAAAQNSHDLSIGLSVVLVLILILINGFFSAAEMAIISLNDNKIKHDAANGDRFAQKILRLTNKPGNFLATIQVGVTLAGFLSSAFAGDRFGTLLYRAMDPQGNSPMLRNLSIILITLIISYLTLVLGELVPKRIALNNPEGVSKMAVSFIRGFGMIVRPFTLLLTHSSNLILRALKIRTDGNPKSVTEEEIRMMIDASSSCGEILSEESLMLQNVFEFNDKEVSEIMVHRKNIIGIPLDASYDELLELAKAEGYTRIPVYEEHMDRIVGIVNIKDLLYFISKYDRSEFDIAKLMREPMFTPESKRVDALFREMQKEHEAMAIVIDEYGGVAGLVTMEDLIEEIVGNIQDEYDDEHPEIVVNPDGSYLVDGLTDLHDLVHLIPGFQLDDEDVDYDTIAGFLIDQLDRIPEEDEHPSLVCGNFFYRILEMDDKRIARVLMRPLSEDEIKAQEKSSVIGEKN